MSTTIGCLRCERTGILSHCHTGVAAPGSRAGRSSGLIEPATRTALSFGLKGGITEIASPRGKLLTAWGQRSDTMAPSCWDEGAGLRKPLAAITALPGGGSLLGWRGLIWCKSGLSATAAAPRVLLRTVLEGRSCGLSGMEAQGSLFL